MKNIRIFGYIALTIGLYLIVGAYWLTGYFQNVALAISSVALGFGIAFLVVNVFLNEEEKKKAAMVLLQLVHESIVKNHEEIFLGKGRDAFGIPEWSSIIQAMNANGRNPDALSPEQRTKVIELIRNQESEIIEVYLSIEEQFKEIGYILGWSFSPQLVRDCMLTRMEITEFRVLISIENPSDEQKMKIIEKYFDIDADSSSVLVLLASILGHDIVNG